MIDVETIQFPIGGHVDARVPLNIKDHARGIDARLLTRRKYKPFGNGIGTDGRGQDFSRVRLHGVSLSFIFLCLMLHDQRQPPEVETLNTGGKVSRCSPQALSTTSVVGNKDEWK